jgi:hypothetical protein
MNQQILIELIKISLIYNMVKDGWRFRSLGNTMEFKKRRYNNENVDMPELLTKHILNIKYPYSQ